MSEHKDPLHSKLERLIAAPAPELPTQPEVKLWLFVTVEAIYNWIYRDDWEDRNWLFNSEELFIGSFPWICEELGWNKRDMRKLFRKAREGINPEWRTGKKARTNARQPVRTILK